MSDSNEINNTPTEATKSEATVETKKDALSANPKLKAIFEEIIKKHDEALKKLGDS